MSNYILTQDDELEDPQILAAVMFDVIRREEPSRFNPVDADLKERMRTGDLDAWTELLMQQPEIFQHQRLESMAQVLFMRFCRNPQTPRNISPESKRIFVQSFARLSDEEISQITQSEFEVAYLSIYSLCIFHVQRENVTAETVESKADFDRKSGQEILSQEYLEAQKDAARANEIRENFAKWLLKLKGSEKATFSFILLKIIDGMVIV